LRVGYALPNGHDLEMTVRRTDNERGDDRTSYLLAYTIPLRLAVSRKKSIGAIRGQVYDPQTPGRPGVAGVILRINAATAVTDRNGRFVFPVVPPGRYALHVDRGSLGQDRIVEQKLPVALEVKAGETTRLELAVVPAAKVTGTVWAVPSHGNGAFVVGEPGNHNARREPVGLANVLVELSSDDEVVRRVTDQRGRFLFDTLRPGRWHLKVYDHNLPAYHYLETAEQDLTLEFGQSLDIPIRVLPKVRQIRFVDSGVIRPSDNHH
jgi:hypothetical protein